MEFQNIFVFQYKILVYFLALVFAFAPDFGKFQFAGEVFVKLVGGLFDCPPQMQNERVFLIRLVPGAFGVNPHHAQRFKSGHLKSIEAVVVENRSSHHGKMWKQFF